MIFGIGPFPEMGIAGSATSTLIANILSLAALILWLRHRRHPLWISRHENAVYKPDLAILRALIVKGVPMGLQMIVISLAMIMMISMVNAYGVDTTSAYGAALQLWTYVQMPAMAIGAACSSMAAQNVGAGHWDRVDATARTGTLFNFLMTGALILPIILFDHSTLSLFLPDGSAALAHRAPPQPHRGVVVPVLRRDVRGLGRGARDRCGDPAAADPRHRAVGHPHSVRQAAAADARRRRDLVEFPRQRAVRDADVAGVLQMGRLAEGEDAGDRTRCGGGTGGSAGAGAFAGGGSSATGMNIAASAFAQA